MSDHLNEPPTPTEAATPEPLPLPAHVSAKIALTQAITEELTRRGLTVDIAFVPFSRSRNAKEKHHSLNWSMALVREDKVKVFDTDYMQGVGHIPNYPHGKLYDYPHGGRSINLDEWEKDICETGKVRRYLVNVDVFIGGKPLPKPDIANVFHSLLLYADAVNYGSFEQWAEDFGYETDSRAAEKTYKACLEIALKLNGIFGAEVLNKWRELGQDM